VSQLAFDLSAPVKDSAAAPPKIEVNIPAGFRRVTADEFFAALYADPRDIMPCNTNSPYYTTWETKSRQVWGWTAPGWKNPRDEKIYALA
jgi:hypothetical protein